VTIYLLPFIAAFIGWFTNWIAIKMLFHPRLPYNFLGITIQGIFPKRQAQFAQKLGELVSRELISFEEITSKINQPATIQKALPLIESHIDQFIKTKLKEEMPLLSMFVTDKSLEGIKTGMVKEIELIFPIIMEKLTQGMQDEFNIEKIVADKVKGFSSDKLEDILNAIMSKEFRFVEIVGAVLGFIIGVIQIFLAKI